MTKGANGDSPEGSTIQRFFKQPILNNPYEYPASHWELDDQGQPTHRIVRAAAPRTSSLRFPRPRSREAPPPCRKCSALERGAWRSSPSSPWRT